MGRKAATETLRAAEADEREYGFLPDADEGRLEAAAAYFDARGPVAERIAAWEYLGLAQEQERASHRAVISYGRALAAAQKAGDNASQGRIGRRLAHVYNASREYVPAARELYSAWLAYRRAAEKAAEKAGSETDASAAEALHHEERATLLEYGQAWYNLDNLEQAEKVYKAALSEAHAAGDTLVEAGTLRSYAALALQKDTPDPAAAVEMLSRVADDLHYPLQSADQGVLAGAYSLLGKSAEARDRLRRAFAQAETRPERSQAWFRAYQVASQEGKSADALKALEKVVEYGNDADLSAMRSAVSLAREDYLDAQNALASERLRASRWGSAALILLLIAVASTALWYLRARREEIRRLRTEAEETIATAEELRLRLAESSRVLKGTVAGKPGDDRERGGIVNIHASANGIVAGRHQVVTIHESCPGGKSNVRTKTSAEIAVRPDDYLWEWSVGDQSGSARGESLAVTGVRLPHGKYTVSVTLTVSCSSCPACRASATETKSVNIGNGVIK